MHFAFPALKLDIYFFILFLYVVELSRVFFNGKMTFHPETQES